MVFTSWFEGGLKAWNVAESLEAVMILWSIWKHRNELVWNSKQQDSNKVLSVAKLNYVDLVDARNKLVVAADSCVVGGVDKWTAPDFPFLKVSVDGALFSSHGSYGVGLVARTVAGIVMAARTLCKGGDLQPHIVEAIGVKEALSWSKANGWTSVIVDSDCLKVISDLQKQKYMVSPYGHILYDCRTLISDFDNISFKFVKRSANKVAHALAQTSLFEADCHFSRDSLPGVIASLVVDDLI
uniref:RNase H type-1 domain-containing protein n=1 Tax=Cannabis sativa TaxID=3483 RepID=A0A803Q8D5_CANSA